MPKTLNTDSQKINLIPELMEQVSLLYQILVTGNVETGEPGLLENTRVISKNVKTLMDKQATNEELERRVKDIEDRHKRLDEQKKRRDPYALAIFSIALSNVVMIVLWVLGFGR
jgi:hypothetical protein